jgi:hypothetical protein
METRSYVMDKVKIIPEDILKEVSDFIDFLEIKLRKDEHNWNWLRKSVENINESDFRDYLSGLQDYEKMLVKGAIKWK